MKLKSGIFITLLAISILSGCATIVGEPNQLLPISSDPEGASVVIIDEAGSEVFKGVTPTSVTLAKSDGSYWGGKEYKVAIRKDGFSAYELPIKASPNGWYIGGNLLFGGLIGYFIVDPMNGNMYTLSAKEVSATLSQKTAENSQQNKDLSIMLIDDVPENLKSKMVKVN